MTEHYSIKELAEAKGTSAPVRAALLALEARVLDLEERLEIPEPPFEGYDGISCRDETITQQDKRIKMLEAALRDWSDKTEWVQKTALPEELGLHRADVLRQRIESRDAEIEQLRSKLERGASTFLYVEGTTYPVHKITEIGSRDD